MIEFVVPSSGYDFPGATIKLHVTLPADYPRSRPRLRIASIIEHINIPLSGVVPDDIAEPLLHWPKDDP